MTSRNYLLPSQANRLIRRVQLFNEKLDLHWKKIEEKFQSIIDRDALNQALENAITIGNNFSRDYDLVKEEVKRAENAFKAWKTERRTTKDRELRNLQQEKAKQETEIKAQIDALIQKKKEFATKTRDAKKALRAKYNQEVSSEAATSKKKIGTFRDKCEKLSGDLKSAKKNLTEVFSETENLVKASLNEENQKEILKEILGG